MTFSSYISDAHVKNTESTGALIMIIAGVNQPYLCMQVTVIGYVDLPVCFYWLAVVNG